MRRHKLGPLELSHAYLMRMMCGIQQLWAGLRVFLDCDDACQLGDGASGIMGTTLFGYELGLGSGLPGMSKAQRLLASESRMTHAMGPTAVAVSVYERTGRPIRWRMQSSWEADSGAPAVLGHERRQDGRVWLPNRRRPSPLQQGGRARGQQGAHNASAPGPHGRAGLNGPSVCRGRHPQAMAVGMVSASVADAGHSLGALARPQRRRLVTDMDL